MEGWVNPQSGWVRSWYWTQDPLHDDPLLYQLNYPGWYRVLITLYLADKWWWLSHCRYWSVWFGFLYTVIDSVLSASGLTMVSKKRMAPSSLLPSTVNLMDRSTLLMCSKKCFLCPEPKPRGVSGSTSRLLLKVFHVKVSHYGADWGPFSSLHLFVEFALEWKYVLCKQNFNKRIMSLTGNTLLSLRV